jgi:hypothetical protein
MKLGFRVNPQDLTENVTIKIIELVSKFGDEIYFGIKTEECYRTPAASNDRQDFTITDKKHDATDSESIKLVDLHKYTNKFSGQGSIGYSEVIGLAIET